MVKRDGEIIDIKTGKEISYEPKKIEVWDAKEVLSRVEVSLRLGPKSQFLRQNY